MFLFFPSSFGVHFCWVLFVCLQMRTILKGICLPTAQVGTGKSPWSTAIGPTFEPTMVLPCSQDLVADLARLHNRTTPTALPYQGASLRTRRRCTRRASVPATQSSRHLVESADLRCRQQKTAQSLQQKACQASVLVLPVAQSRQHRARHQAAWRCRRHQARPRLRMLVLVLGWGGVRTQ